MCGMWRQDIYGVCAGEGRGWVDLYTRDFHLATNWRTAFDPNGNLSPLCCLVSDLDQILLSVQHGGGWNVDTRPYLAIDWVCLVSCCRLYD